MSLSLNLIPCATITDSLTDKLSLPGTLSTQSTLMDSDAGSYGLQLSHTYHNSLTKGHTR